MCVCVCVCVCVCDKQSACVTNRGHMLLVSSRQERRVEVAYPFVLVRVSV